MLASIHWLVFTCCASGSVGCAVFRLRGLKDLNLAIPFKGSPACVLFDSWSEPVQYRWNLVAVRNHANYECLFT